jgi:hypothetical protein
VKKRWESGQHDKLEETGSSVKDGDGSLGGRNGKGIQRSRNGECWRRCDMVRGDWGEAGDRVLGESAREGGVGYLGVEHLLMGGGDEDTTV